MPNLSERPFTISPWGSGVSGEAGRFSRQFYCEGKAATAAGGDQKNNLVRIGKRGEKAKFFGDIVNGRSLSCKPKLKLTKFDEHSFQKK